jgi:hypothetical protein
MSKLKTYEVEFGYTQNGIRSYKTLQCKSRSKKGAVEQFVLMTYNPEYFSLSNTNISFATEKICEIDEES